MMSKSKQLEKVKKHGQNWVFWGSERKFYKSKVVEQHRFTGKNEVKLDAGGPLGGFLGGKRGHFFLNFGISKNAIKQPHSEISCRFRICAQI